MREYMITVIGGAVLAALAHTLSPEKWTKYIKIVTGIMIVSIIVSPVSVMIHGDMFSDFEESTYIEENLHEKAVISQTEQKLSEDVVSRIKSELGEDITAEVVLAVSDVMQVEGVDMIKVWNGQNRERIKKILTEVYSPSEISFQD